MAEEKIFTINLRKEFSKKPKYKRSKKAIIALKEFIIKNLKVKEVKIGRHLNLKIWEQGRKNPPSKIKVKSIVDDGIAYVELTEFQFEKKQQKEEKKTKEISQKEAEQEKKKEKEKELQKEAKHEEQVKQKKEHKEEIMGKPDDRLKHREKIKEDKDKYGKVIPETGKKGAKDPKP